MEESKKIREVVTDAVRRNRANREIDAQLLQFHHQKSILQLLPVIRRKCSPTALAVAIERVERKKDELEMEDAIFFEVFKAELEKSK